MGGFATGFFSQLGDQAKESLDRMHTQDDEQRRSMASLYLNMLQNPNLDETQRNNINQAFMDLYKHNKGGKELAQKIGQAYAFGHKLIQAHKNAAQGGGANAAIPGTEQTGPMSEQTPIGGSSVNPPGTAASTGGGHVPPPYTGSFPTAPPPPVEDDTGPKANGAGATAAPASGGQKPTALPDPNQNTGPYKGVNVSSGGDQSPIAGAGGPIMTAQAQPPQAPQQTPAAKPAKQGKPTPPPAMNLGAILQQAYGAESTEATHERVQRQALDARQKLADELVTRKLMQPNSAEYRDFVLFGTHPTAGELKVPSAVDAELNAARDSLAAGDQEGYEQHLKSATDMSKAKKGGVSSARKAVEGELDQAAELLDKGDAEGAQKHLDIVNKLTAAQKGAGKKTMNDWYAQSVLDPDSEKRDEANAVIKKYADVASAIGAARFVAGARERARYVFGNYLDAATQEQFPASEYDVAQMIKQGRQITKIGTMTPNQILPVQRFDREALGTGTPGGSGGAIADVRKYLQAYDQGANKEIFARLLSTSSPVIDGYETDWVGNILDQALTEKGLTEDGRHLVIALKRLNQTTGEMRAALNLPSTNAAVEMMRELVPGGRTPNSKVARELMDKFEINARNAITIPLLRGITPGAGAPQHATTPGVKPTRPSGPPAANTPAGSNVTDIYIK